MCDYKNLLEKKNNYRIMRAIAHLHAIDPELAEKIANPLRYVPDNVKVAIEELKKSNPTTFYRLSRWEPKVFKDVVETFLKTIAVLMLVENGYEPKKAIELAPDPEVKVTYNGDRVSIEYIVDRKEVAFFKASLLKKLQRSFSTLNDPPTSSIMSGSASGLSFDLQALRQYVKELTSGELDEEVADKAVEAIRKKSRKNRLSSWLVPLKDGTVGRPVHSYTSPAMHLILAFLYVNDEIAPIPVGSVADFVVALLPRYKRAKVNDYIHRLKKDGLIMYENGEVKLTDLGRLWVVQNASRILDTVARYIDFKLVFESGSSPRRSSSLSLISSLFKKNLRFPQIGFQFTKVNRKVSKRERESIEKKLMKWLSHFLKKVDKERALRGQLSFESVLYSLSRMFEFEQKEIRLLSISILLAQMYGIITIDLDTFARHYKAVYGEDLGPEEFAALRRLNWMRFLYFNARKKLVALWDLGKVVAALVQDIIQHAFERFVTLLHKIREWGEAAVELAAGSTLAEQVEELVSLARYVSGPPP